MPLGVKQNPEWVAKRIASRLATLRAKGFPKTTGPKSQEARDAASKRMADLWKDPAWRANAIAVASRPRGPMPQYRREKISARLKGRKQSPELIEKRAAALRGKKHTPERCAKISAARIGIRPTAEQRLRMSASQRGRKHSLETRAKIASANRGKKISLECRERIRRAAIGRVISPETRSKLAEASRRRKGPLSARWKGGISHENLRLRNSEEVRIWRSAVYKRDNHTCRRCGTRGGFLNAHHVKPFAEFPELRTEVSNGITLCRACHKKVHDEMRSATTEKH